MILCIDVGGTAVKLGLLDSEGNIRCRDERPVNGDGYRTPILTSALRAAEAFLAACPSEGEPLEGVAVSATGQVDDQRGIVIGTNGSIPGYEGTDFKEAFEKAYHVPTHVLNDANAAVLGETFFGAGRGYRDVVMVTLGTGVGGGVVSGGLLIRGHRGIAGELGHFSIDWEGVPCSCGNRGCFERYASTTALMAMAREALGADAPKDGRDFFRRVEQGENTLQQILRAWLDCVAVGIIGLSHIFNPEIVLIGGGVSRQEKLLIQPLRERVKHGLMPRFAEGFRLEAARLGNDAGMMGALSFWMEQERESI